MKKLMLALTIILVVTFVNGYSQSESDFIIIDQIADNITQLRSEFENQSNVYVTNGISPNALIQISNAIEKLQIEDLHIYVPTKPGAIVFSSIAVTADNVNILSADIEAWGRNVTNKVVIHSDVVFEGDQGTLLKQQLENITGLVFISQK